MILTDSIRYFVATGYDQLQAVELVYALRDLYQLIGENADGTRV